MAFAGVDGDPFSFALFAVFEVAMGSDRASEQAGFAEHVGDGAGAIVAGVVLMGVAAAPFVGFALQAVAGGDGAFHGCGRAFRRIGVAVSQKRGAAVFKMVGNRLSGFHLIRA